ncbi:MAG TPA: RcpC/CpaB family pilus assembly protein [Acidimicrobiia bacterium]|nr:RcpC/CpaB family pilus assembly protein [Acidimicrobiia bacterium]
MAMRRSTQMLLLGLAVFVIGTGVVLVSLGGDGGGGGSERAALTPTTVQPGTVVIPAAGAVAATSFTIPEGKQAAAVQLPYVAGLAGYAKGGDLVNVYATIEKGQTAESTIPPTAKLVLPGVEVLAVTGPVPGSDAGNATYLLALDAVQAEQVIFFSKFESLWMTLVPKGQPPATTPGRSYQNAL